MKTTSYKKPLPQEKTGGFQRKKTHPRTNDAHTYEKKYEPHKFSRFAEQDKKSYRSAQKDSEKKYEPRKFSRFAEQDKKPYRSTQKDSEKKYEPHKFSRFAEQDRKSYRSTQKDSEKKYEPHKFSRFAPPHKKTFRPKQKERNEDVFPNSEVRLNKFIANSGICSRRGADEYILNGEITVNGKVVKELGTKILPSDEVKFHEQRLLGEKKRYLLLNKPKGFITTSDDPQARRTVMDLVQNACPERIYPVGRLDRNSTGVLLFTNDGELAKQLTHPSYNKKKIYRIFLNKNFSKEDMYKLVNGVMLEDGLAAADEASYVDEKNDRTQIGVEIHSGKNRIVRRMFEELGYEVKRLDRVYFAGLTKKSLDSGKWRMLTPKEVSILKMGAYQ